MFLYLFQPILLWEFWNYFLKSATINPSTLLFTAVFENSISFPFSLNISNLVVYLDGTIKSSITESNQTVSCSTSSNEDCVQEETISFNLPINSNCSVHNITINFNLIVSLQLISMNYQIVKVFTIH